MKLLSILISLFVSTSILADTVAVVKVLDGKTAFCKNKVDAYRNKFQAYTVRTVSLNRSTNNELSLSFKTIFLSCQNKKGKYAFVKVNPRDTFSYNVFVDIDDNGDTLWRQFYAETQKLIGVIFNHDTQKRLYKEEIEENIDFNISLNQILNSDQMTKLEQGGLVKTSFDFFLQRDLRLYNVDKEDSPIKYYVNYGSYKFKIELKNVEGVYSLKLL